MKRKATSQGSRHLKRTKHIYVPRPVKRAIKKAVWGSKETHKNTDFLNEASLNSVSTTPSYYDSAFKLTQGDTYRDRTGHKVKAVGIKIRGLLHNNWSSPMWVRFLVLINKRGTADTDYTTGTSLFEDNTGNVNFGSTTGNQALIARINREKYTVLRDRIIKLGGDATGDKIKQIKTWIPFRARLEYDGTASQAPVRHQPIVLMFCGQGDTDVAGGQVIENSMIIDFYFKDM